ncbi:MAG: TIGR01621 family pseudouridine synthase [Spirochaetes bacterium]|nr:TIGR01621 family pseudouridine synthase [Spirochaetota bacterium]
MPPFVVVETHPDFVVIDKAPGVDFHGSEGKSGLCERVRQATGLTELFPVHRLDSITSGLMLFARSQKTANELSKLFAEHRVGKYYLAIGTGRPSKTQGEVRGDLARARRGAWMLTRGKTNPSITKFFSAGLGDGLRLFLLRPLTGKTHQLRVVLKSLGSPVLGDPLYGKAAIAADRAYLHAWRLSFRLDGFNHDLRRDPKLGSHFAAAAVVERIESLWKLMAGLKEEPLSTLAPDDDEP